MSSRFAKKAALEVGELPSSLTFEANVADGIDGVDVADGIDLRAGGELDAKTIVGGDDYNDSVDAFGAIVPLDGAAQPDELAASADGKDDGMIISGASSDDFLRSYINFVSQMPYLTDQEEVELLKRVAKGDEKAVEDLVKSHLRLVVKIALGYYRYGLPTMDLISEGNLGLVTAVRKFDSSKGNRLSTYAVWWIKAMMQNFILKSWSIVKIASTVAERNLFFNLQKIKRRLNIDKDSSLSDAQVVSVADIANVDVDSVKRMDARLMSGDKSIDSPVGHGDDAATLGEVMPSKDNSPEQEFLLNDYRMNIAKSFNEAMLTLLPRERQILLYRINNDTKEMGGKRTLEDIGKEFGISSERVRQIADKAMKKLRIAMTESMKARGVEP